jgi:hypothetical protein
MTESCQRTIDIFVNYGDASAEKILHTNRELIYDQVAFCYAGQPEKLKQARVLHQQSDVRQKRYR